MNRIIPLLGGGEEEKKNLCPDMYATQRGPDLQFKINLPFGGCMSRGPIELKESFNLINMLGIFSRCLEFLGQVHSYALIRGISGSLARLEDGR